jgi:vancomycin resistance protein YoaR
MVSPVSRLAGNGYTGRLPGLLITMSRNLRIFVIALAALAGLFLIVLVGFGIDRAFHADEVLRNVAVSEIDLSGLDVDEASAALQAFEDELVITPALFQLNGSTLTLDPATVGFSVDKATAAEAALATGRSGSIFKQFGWWWSHLFKKEVLELPVSLNEDAFATVAADWSTDHISDPPFDGAILIEDVTPVAQYPREGRRVEVDSAAVTVLQTLAERDRAVGVLEIGPAAPALSDGDVDQALERAVEMLSGPVVLSRLDPPISVTFTVEDLARAFTSDLISNSETRLATGFNAEVVEEIIAPFRSDLELPPVDASFEFNEDYTVSVIPGKPGTLIDPVLATAALEGAALVGSRQGTLPFEDGAEPEFSTEDAEAMGIKHLVSRFTTYHACCEKRVDNIQLFADKVDGTIVQPGEALSLNVLVGERTLEDGFKPAGTIIKGKIVDTVGGGVSQFATTFYNAVFWGGYEDITHTAHSYYFSRYPEGIEATISWPVPNLEFRNNRDTAIMIRTSHTDTSITVSFYGNNGGRVVIGEQSGGITRLTVPSEGDGTGYVVEGEVSGRYSYSEPPIEYTANEAITPGEERVIEGGRQGWTVTVTQIITYADRTVDEISWPVRYRPQPREVEVHPCTLPSNHADYVEECPPEETTTTTTTEDTTTSTDTTTTTAGGG